MPLNSASKAARAGTVHPHHEHGFPLKLTGTVNGHRFVNADGTQATAGSLTVIGVLDSQVPKVSGDNVHIMQGPHPVIADDVLAVGQPFKSGDGGRAVGFIGSAQSGVTIDDSVGVAFTNQPANDGIEVLSANAGDTTQTVTIIGTTVSTDTVVVETVTLNGTTPVATVKTNWGLILAVKKSAATLGTVTVREASADQTVTAGLTAAVLSVGVVAVPVADQQSYNVAPTIVADSATTKQVGLQGTNSAGTTIYDSQALAGTTAQTMNVSFKRVTELYVGDLEVARTVTVKTGAEESYGLRLGRALTAATAQNDRIAAFIAPQ